MNGLTQLVAGLPILSMITLLPFVGALLIALFEVIFPALPLIFPALFGGDAVGWVFSQTAASILLYVAVLAILFFRPQGLFGETVQRRA